MTRASGFETSTDEPGTQPDPGHLLTDQLRLMASHFPEEAALIDVDSDRRLTFAGWDAASDQVAAALLDVGVEKGDTVAIFLPMEECLEWVVAYAAIHKAGAVAVPTSTRLASRELEYVMGHSAAVAAFAGAGTAEILEGVRRSLPSLRWVAVSSKSSSPERPWSGLGEPGRAVQVEVTADDMADVMYTSGTTGRPKGVVVRHRNVAMVPNGLPNWSGDGWLHSSPLFTFAGISSIYNPMKLGMTGLYQPRFDAGAWLEHVETRRPAATFIVPAMAQLLISHPRFEEADLSSLRMASLGSAPLAPDTFRRLQERLPHAWVSNNWGMTEAGSAYCILPPEEASRRVGSVGKPMPPVQFRIVDEGGRELPAGEVGELLVSNPGKEREYFNDPEATKAAWRDGWLHTGDLARLDEDGYLYIVGRIKDVIIRGGNNVHAGDVEAVIAEFPGVQEVAVAGVPHSVLGEDVAAWIVPVPGTTVDGAKLKEFLAERLSDYKIPRRITMVESLPRNATGKVVKRELVEGRRG
ncbi:MAG TPA: class I adenylate-forming enzyme family protein [Acidimicrobiales bacterium]|nr:class I adenylate-forming enzyme family protein [Acidimicrobiales bacterium]